MSGRLPPQSQLPHQKLSSATQACRRLLQNTCSQSGHFIPLTAADVALQLLNQGFVLSQEDVEGLLHDLAVAGDAVEMDAAAGFRWKGRLA